MTTLADLFRWMDNEVGVVETPAHSNHVVLRNGKDLWVDYVGYQPPTQQAQWCALFQSVADWENGTPLPPIQFDKGFLGVDLGRQWFSDHGLLSPTPKDGYLAFYQEHVGRVRDASGWPGPFLSLEGNEGDGVRLVTRYPNEVQGGFGVRDYAGAAPRPLLTSAQEAAMVVIPPDGKSYALPVPDWAHNFKLTSVGTAVHVSAGSDTAPGGWPVVYDGWIAGHRTGWPDDPVKVETVVVTNRPADGQGKGGQALGVVFNP